MDKVESSNRGATATPQGIKPGAMTNDSIDTANSNDAGAASPATASSDKPDNKPIKSKTNSRDLLIDGEDTIEDIKNKYANQSDTIISLQQEVVEYVGKGDDVSFDNLEANALDSLQITSPVFNDIVISTTTAPKIPAPPPLIATSPAPAPLVTQPGFTIDSTGLNFSTGTINVSQTPPQATIQNNTEVQTTATNQTPAPNILQVGWQAAKDTATTVVNTLSNTVNTVKTSVTNGVNAMVTGIANTAKSFTNDVVNAVDQFGDFVSGIFQPAPVTTNATTTTTTTTSTTSSYVSDTRDSSQFTNSVSFTINGVAYTRDFSSDNPVVAAMVSQNDFADTNGTISATGCAFLTCVAVAEIVANRTLTEAEINDIWNTATTTIVTCYDPDNNFQAYQASAVNAENAYVRNGDELIQQALAYMGIENAKVKIDNTNWGNSGYTKIAKRKSKSSTTNPHVMLADIDGDLIWDPYNPDLSVSDPRYTSIWIK